MKVTISEKDVEAYRNQGAICIRGLLDAEWIDRMGRAVDHITANPGPMRESYSPDQPFSFFSEKFLWTIDPEFRNYVFNTPVASAAGHVMQSSKVNLFYDHLLVKEPGTKAETGWHQDCNFWPFKGKQICSVWAPLDVVDETNGALEFVSGSHEWYDHPMSRATLFGNRDGQPMEVDGGSADAIDTAPPQPDIEANRDKYDILRWRLEPGDVLIFAAMTLHYAPPNLTDGRRRALSTRWLGDDVRFHLKRKMLQMIRDPGLTDGQVPDCELFPTIWRRAGTKATEPNKFPDRQPTGLASEKKTNGEIQVER